MSRSLLIALAVLTFGTSWATAQPFSPKDLDARIEKQLFDVLTLGTDIYNRGSHDACFRLYQGSLMTVVGFLDHRPDQALKINKALKSTDQMTNVSERAFTLRTAIDDLREAIKPGLMGQQTATPGRPTLWYRLGGESSISQMIDEVINRSMKNPRINFTRGGTGNQWEANPENLTKAKKRFVLWFSSVSGGPYKFEGKDLRAIHQNMKITAAEFDSFMLEVKAVLDKYFVPNAESNEVVALFEGKKNEIIDSTVVIKSLWDRMGGEPAVTLVVDDFVTRAAKDPAANFTRKEEGTEWKATPTELAELKKQLVQWVSSVTKGPLKYEGKSLADIRAGMKITNAQYTALMLDLKASLEKLKVNPLEQDELLSTISGFRKDIVETK
ncbi:MAG: group 1 truncated hemoglobin [Gemmatales bacterium]